MRRRQLGDAVGTLIVLIALGVAGYYGYQYFLQAEEKPSCKAQLNACIAKCRRTSTEAPEMTACQQACRAKADACQD